MDSEKVKIKKAFSLVEQGIHLLKSGPLDYYLQELIAAHDMLMNRFCPHKVGDYVVLIEDVYGNEKYASYSKYPFLIAGAVGKVVSTQFSGGQFLFGLQFETEHWVVDFGKNKGTIHRDPNAHNYAFREKHIARWEKTSKDLFLGRNQCE